MLRGCKKTNETRLPEAQRYVENGGKCLVELGCGTGEFAARLAEKTQRWVIGIEAQPEQIFYSPLEYERTERFLCLYGNYRLMMDDQTMAYPWLFGSARKTFVTMPYPGGALEEEIAFWLRLTAPGGELHVRTEISSLSDRISVPRPHLRIPFDPEAEDINSSHAGQAQEVGQVIYSFGIKLL